MVGHAVIVCSALRRIYNTTQEVAFLVRNARIELMQVHFYVKRRHRLELVKKLKVSYCEYF